MSIPELFSQTPATHHIYLMRHGESEGNLQGIMQGRRDYPLTERGRTQAEAAANWFQNRAIDLVLSSPQTRALETARIVHRSICPPDRELPLHTLEDLSEVDLGCFSGLTRQDAAIQFPELARRVQIETWDAVPDAEHSDRLRERAVRVWERIIIELGNRRNMLVVSHGGFLQWLIKTSMGADDTRWNLRFHSSNCGIHECALMRRSAEHVILEWNRINMVASSTGGV